MVAMDIPVYTKRKRTKVMDTRDIQDTNYEVTSVNGYWTKLDPSAEAVTEWLASIDGRLKSINSAMMFFQLVVAIGVVILLIQVVF
jgi:hypothetical protein